MNNKKSKSPKKKKTAPKKSRAQRVENRKKVFRLFDRLVMGAVKIWLTDKAGVNSPYIIAVDQVDEFIKSKIEDLK